MNSTANLAARLEELLGSTGVLSSEVELHKYAIAGRTPMIVAKPAHSVEVEEVVRFAESEKLVVICCGARTKLDIGMPPHRYGLALDLGNLAEIPHYDPDDLTLSVDAGLSLKKLSKVLAEKGQFLPLAVPHFDRSTIGGTVASGIDSLYRLQFGTARDLLIGAEFVDGKGQLCKSGGRVVKNVTGYDIHKLLIGSLGTLAAITRLNFRTFPLPELRAGFLANFSSAESAGGFRSSLLQSGLPFLTLELFDPEFSVLLHGVLKNAGNPVADTVSRRCWGVFAAFIGNEAVVRRIQRELENRTSQSGAVSGAPLDASSNEHFSDSLRETSAWLPRAAPEVAVFRIAKPQWFPVDFGEGKHIRENSELRAALLVSGSNTALLTILCNSSTDKNIDAFASYVERLLFRLNANDGSAALLHAPDWLKARCNVWGPQRPDFPLVQRVKAAFDPVNVFAPGRFVGGL
ncbi:MAG TPA: FAD-binding oxidoreductase [Candidatus Eisenbacteria bacterium]|nr:FAD-binding oxidoreductase [Candidatus Eisenbacteria bacterium]